MKKYNAVSKTFDAIKAAGQNGDSSKAKTAYKKVGTKVCLSHASDLQCYHISLKFIWHVIFVYVLQLGYQ